MPSKQDLEGADTLGPAARPDDATVPPSAAAHPAVAPTLLPESGKLLLPGGFPVARWDRYELLSELGKGGMGAVYKARDKRLGRIVALKFILGAHPNLVMRFLQEARAQARIDHPNVCHVYEVGEVEGRAYIAMQLIEGEQLTLAARQMSLDEKVAAMRDVAVAIHEAHKLGIVHRDLKPANILVERGEDKRWFPVVMDFGLAREATTEAGLTESGALLGTPAYMSPEQARGDGKAVDRRSDVYSLGATFYELITGRPPFGHQSLALALEDVIKSDPASPRSLDTTVPVDLETIALKCLAKEPERRYASARALADDLGRYLDGEPILGRRPSLWHRLRLRARRNRALVTVSASSLVVILALAALGVRAAVMSRRERARAAERARLAESLGRDAKEIEWLLRAAYQLPLHDTTPERELTRARMQRIAATKHDLGALGEATIHGALGRGHLALHEWGEAAEELARAAGEPGLHAARGRALGELYHRALEDARRSGDPAWLARRKKELEQKYLAPALAELERSRADGENAEDASSLEALVALYRRDYALAETRALEAVARAPWLFEARKVAADAAYESAVEKFDHGQYDLARAGLDHATSLYAQAAEVARSDASVHESAAEAWKSLAEIDARQGRSPMDTLDKAMAATDRAAQADPHDAAVYTTRAYVLLRRSQNPWLQGQAPLLEQLEAAASRAVEIDPRDAAAWDALGNTHVYRGQYETLHGGDPTAWWKRSLDEIGKALVLNPNYPWAHNDLGVAHRWLGAHAAEAGGDPMPEWTAAIRSYEHAAALDPRYLFVHANLVDIEAAVAGYQADHGVDPSHAVENARRAGDECLAIDPSFAEALASMAQAELHLANHLLQAGRDPARPLAAARGDLDRSSKTHDTNPVVHFQRLNADWIEAKYRLQTGVDPSPSIAAGQKALAEVLALDADCAECLAMGARLRLVEASRLAHSGHSPVAALENALTEARRAIALDPSGRSNARVVAATACLRLAGAGAKDGGRVGLRDGLAYARAALALDPGNADAHAVNGALLAAQWRQSQVLALAATARDEAARALAINPLLKREWGEALRDVLPK